MTGMDTASIISVTLAGSAILATPPDALISAGTFSSAITDTAPDSSAITACSAFMTSIITPPLVIFANPFFKTSVPCNIFNQSPVNEILFHSILMLPFF